MRNQDVLDALDVHTTDLKSLSDSLAALLVAPKPQRRASEPALFTGSIVAPLAPPVQQQSQPLPQQQPQQPRTNSKIVTASGDNTHVEHSQAQKARRQDSMSKVGSTGSGQTSNHSCSSPSNARKQDSSKESCDLEGPRSKIDIDLFAGDNTPKLGRSSVCRLVQQPRKSRRPCPASSSYEAVEVFKEYKANSSSGEDKDTSRQGSKASSSSIGDGTNSRSSLSLGNTKPRIIHNLSSFKQPDNTILIFDWDDTLFPTTWLFDVMQYKVGKAVVVEDSVRELLRQCAIAVLKIMHFAVCMANQIVIVTLARQGWLDACIEAFAPELEGQFKRLGVKVVYARYALQDEATDDKQERTTEYWVQAKATAIARECENFYKEQAWANVIAIGDSDYEIIGSQSAIHRWARANRRIAWQLPRLKTVKLLGDSSCSNLIVQLKVVEGLLQELVTKDASVGIDLEDLAGPINVESARALLNSTERNIVEPLADAVCNGLIWKLCTGSNPEDEGRWRQRRLWISKSGILWYESLKDVRPMVFFNGVSVEQIVVTALGDLSNSIGEDMIEEGASMVVQGNMLYGMEFKLTNPDDGSSETKIFAAPSLEERNKWMKVCQAFRDRDGIIPVSPGAAKKAADASRPRRKIP